MNSKANTKIKKAKRKMAQVKQITENKKSKVLTKDDFMKKERDVNEKYADRMALLIDYDDKRYRPTMTPNGYSWRCKAGKLQIHKDKKTDDGKYIVFKGDDKTDDVVEWPYVDDTSKGIIMNHCELISEAKWDAREDKKQVRKTMLGLLAKERKKKRSRDNDCDEPDAKRQNSPN
jgi:hypothetical protein